MAKRLDKELAEFAKGGQDWVEVAPKADNRFELIAKITGPVNKYKNIIINHTFIKKAHKSK